MSNLGCDYLKTAKDSGITTPEQFIDYLSKQIGFANAALVSARYFGSELIMFGANDSALFSATDADLLANSMRQVFGSPITKELGRVVRPDEQIGLRNVDKLIDYQDLKGRLPSEPVFMSGHVWNRDTSIAKQYGDLKRHEIIGGYRRISNTPGNLFRQIFAEHGIFVPVNPDRHELPCAGHVYRAVPNTDFKITQERVLRPVSLFADPVKDVVVLREPGY